MTKSILDSKFKYVPADRTDLKKTFERVKKEQEQARKKQEEKVKPIAAWRTA